MCKAVLPGEEVVWHFEVVHYAAAFLRDQVKVRRVDVSFIGIDDHSHFKKYHFPNTCSFCHLSCSPPMGRRYFLPQTVESQC